METLQVEQQAKNILQTLQNQKTNIQILLQELEKNKYKTLSNKNLEKIKQNTWIAVYFDRHKIDVLTKFKLLYTEVNNNWTHNWWLEFNIFTIEELKQELDNQIWYKEENIKKAKKTIQHQKGIVKRYKKIIELLKVNSFDNYDSEILKVYKNSLSNSFLLK